MTPSSNATGATNRRQSCDRCHGQKLRCTRPDNRKTGACDRCLRKGAQCIYSSSLPKGRPPLYNLNNEAAVRGKTPPNTSAVSTAQPIKPVTPVTPATPIIHRQTDQKHEGVMSVFQGMINQDEDIDMDIHSNAFAVPGSMDSFADFWASGWPEDQIEDNVLDMNPSSILNADHPLKIQPPATLDFSYHFANSPDGPLTGSSGDSGIDNDLAETGSTISSSSNRGFEVSITHLSRLSTRLSQLLGCSRCFLAEALDQSGPPSSGDPAMQVQLGIEAVFKSINTWLMCDTADPDMTSSLGLDPTNAFDLLHHVFSASSYLLEILRHVRISAGTSTLSSVVHHLILVCATLLANMYAAILIALQRCADALSYSLHVRARNMMEPVSHMDVGSRVQLQLVFIVQQCAYFIKCQNQGLETLMSNDLKTEVEQRLTRLQRSLSIDT